MDMNYLNKHLRIDRSIRIVVSILLTSTIISCSRNEKDPIESGPKEEEKLTGIALSSSVLDMHVGDEITLSVILSPSSISNVPIVWSSENEEVVTVVNGKVSALLRGESTITASTQDKKFSDSCKVVVKSRWEAVDLGVGVLWASANLGADEPYESGGYYFWGETEARKDFTFETYKWYPHEKYYHDRKFVLDDSDDAARVALGDDWRTPSPDEWMQLFDECECKRETLNGIDGIRVISANGNSIFLPFCGYMVDGNEQLSNSGYMTDTEYLYSGVSTEKPKILFGSHPGGLGVPIRPIKSLKVTDFSIGVSTLEVKQDEKVLVPISFSPSRASITSVVWKSDNEGVAIVSDGIVLGINPGTAKITATSMDGTKTSECVVIVQEWSYPEPESVNMGLSVEWASWNLGAASPTDRGDYFAWGETSHKSFFGKENYKFYDEGGNFIKYSVSNSVLDEEDDAASQLLSNGWRMPTVAEVDELAHNCSITSVVENGIEGYRVTAKNGNSIFFPDFSYKVRNGLNEYYRGGDFSTMWTSSFGIDDPHPTGGPFDCWTRFLGTAISPSAHSGAIIRPVRYVTSRDLTLNVHKVRLEVGETFEGIKSLNGANHSLSWCSRDDSVVSVEGGDNGGSLTAHKEGQAWVVALAERGGAKDSCLVVVEKWQYPVAEVVDLGLKVKWASWNIGSTSPEDPGDYFVWGQTEHGRDYSSVGKQMVNKYLFYTDIPSEELLSEDDVAVVQWGEGWRIPSKEDYEELLANCTTEEATVNGIHGMYFKGPNGNKVFFPVLGFMSGNRIGSIQQSIYLTRSFSKKAYNISYAMFWDFSNTSYTCDLVDIQFGYQTIGMNVRPVRQD